MCWFFYGLKSSDAYCIDSNLFFLGNKSMDWCLFFITPIKLLLIDNLAGTRTDCFIGVEFFDISWLTIIVKFFMNPSFSLSLSFSFYSLIFNLFSLIFYFLKRCLANSIESGSLLKQLLDSIIDDFDILSYYISCWSVESYWFCCCCIIF